MVNLFCLHAAAAALVFRSVRVIYNFACSCDVREAAVAAVNSKRAKKAFI